MNVFNLSKGRFDEFLRDLIRWAHRVVLVESNGKKQELSDCFYKEKRGRLR